MQTADDPADYDLGCDRRARPGESVRLHAKDLRRGVFGLDHAGRRGNTSRIAYLWQLRVWLDSLIMALHGNRSVLNKSPGRFLNGGVAILRSTFNKHGMQRNAYQAFSPIAATPNGHLAPSAWVLPKTGGGMSSFNAAKATITGSGLAVGGITTTGESSMVFAFADATGQLISSGNGTATLTITSNTPLLTASIGGSGSTTITVSTNVPTLGAEASLQGSASITVTVANATALPLDDTSPLRTGSAMMTFSGTLTPYAIGIMDGTTEEAGLTNAGIATSVWAKVIEAGFSADQILRILAAQAAGAATGLEGSNPQFKGLDGTTTRIDGSYSAGTRTIDSLNGD